MQRLLPNSENFPFLAKVHLLFAETFVSWLYGGVETLVALMPQVRQTKSRGYIGGVETKNRFNFA